MNSKYVILSNDVDMFIQELLPDIDIMLFSSIRELSDYIDESPIRATKIFVTREALVPSVRQAVETLVDMCKSTMFKVDNVVYITEKDSSELGAIRYIINELGLDNWSIVEGNMTRDFITSTICNRTEDEDAHVDKRAVYRVRKADYIQDKLNHKEVLEQHFESEEERLGKLPNVDDNMDTPIYTSTRECKVVYNTGLDCRERDLFIFLLAQYCSYQGKTILIEKDFEFLSLSDLVTRASNVKFLDIDIAELYSNFNGAIREIATCPEKLIIITAHHRIKRDYNFIFNLLLTNLKDIVSYIFKTDDIQSIVSSIPYNVIMPNNVVDIIKTLDKVPSEYNKHNRYIGVDITNLKELNVLDNRAFKVVVQEILKLDEADIDIEATVMKVTSTVLGGETHDLRLYVE